MRDRRRDLADHQCQRFEGSRLNQDELRLIEVVLWDRSTLVQSFGLNTTSNAAMEPCGHARNNTGHAAERVLHPVAKADGAEV
jgi:hypothetical protein